MICPKCNRVVRPGNTYGRNETCTERRYYCSCGHVTRTAEQAVLTWRKTQYRPRVAVVPVPAVIPTVIPTPPAPVVVDAPKPKRGKRKANITPT